MPRFGIIVETNLNGENEMYRDWTGTLKEYIAQEFCPIALSNIEELIRECPGLKVVVSSTWRFGETVETLKKILSPSKLVSEAIIGVTPYIREENREVNRGIEIQHYLTNNPEITDFAIIDDDDDMEHLMDKLVLTSELHGFQYADIKRALTILGESNSKSPVHLI